MRRWRLLLLIAVVGSLASCRVEPAPRIEVVGPDRIDFGPYPARENKVARYTIRNTGSAPLKILQIRKNCGCAAATSDKQELKPKEEARIDVTILPNSIFGPYSKNAWVETSDPKSPFLRLTMAGTAIPLVEIKPTDYVYAGRIPTNTSWSQSFELEATEEGVKLGALKTESNLPVEMSLNRAGHEQRGRYQLVIRVLPAFESGDLRCSISIPVLEPTNLPPIKISIAGTVGSELCAVPGVFKLPLSEQPITRRFVLRVLGQSSRVLDPASLKLPRQAGASFKVEQDEDGLRVIATFSSEFTKQLYADEETRLSFEVPGASSAKVVCKTRKRANHLPANDGL